MNNMEKLIEVKQKLEAAQDYLCTAYEMIDEMADEYGCLDEAEREIFYENLVSNVKNYRDNDAFCFPIRDEKEAS